jgi:hypothetical protein
MRARQKLFSRQVLITTVGSIVLGCFVSALWDFGVKPGVAWLTNASLDIITLGMNSLRDKLYADVARGAYDRPAAITFALVVSWSAMVIFIWPLALGYGFKIMMWRLVRPVNLVGAARNIPTGARPQTLRGAITLVRSTVIGGSVILGLLAGCLFFITTRVLYIQNTAIYLDQSQRILSAYWSDHERLQVASRVALMKSRVDFDKIQSDMARTASSNGVELPKFTPY